MKHTTLIAADEVARHLDDPDWVIADCRFNLMDPSAGRKAYLEGHVPGARYVHLDEDMSSAPATDHGRHPLPPPARLETLFSRLGVAEGVQVVAYDDADGAMAARLWWLLRYMGHDAVAVMDGGFRAWTAAGHPLDAGQPEPAPRVFRGRPRREWLVTLEQVPTEKCLIDARAAARYRGDEEPLDPAAGHIPGARNHPYHSNLQRDGRFLAPATVKARLEQTLAGADPGAAVYYCGSGVSACHLLLAAAHAGLPPGRLYAGSWSEWCRDRARPVARGPEPGPPLTE